MNDHDRFAHDDAAYLLGALSETETRAFEQHLATCLICRDAVAEISGVPAMLSGISESDLAETAHDAPPDTLLPALLRAARRQRQRRRWIAGTAASLAAAAIVALSVALVGSGSGAAAPKPQAMTALVSSPVEATATLQDVSWGTRITLACTYHSVYSPDVAYNLVVHDKKGAVESGGSWQLIPGRTTQFVGGASVHRDQIASIDITAGSTPILTLRF